MGIKLEEKYIKNKIKSIHGEIEVYNPLDKAIYGKLSKMIANNSQEIAVEDGKSDVEINNTIAIMRFMLKNLTNIENEDYWNNIDDYDLEVLLNHADGDFKNAISDVLDIMLEIGQDNRRNATRQLDILNDKIKELTEIFNFNNDIDKTLAKVGLNRDLLIKIEQGDKQAIEEFQKHLISNQKGKRKYTKKQK